MKSGGVFSSYLHSMWQLGKLQNRYIVELPQLTKTIIYNLSFYTFNEKSHKQKLGIKLYIKLLYLIYIYILIL